MNTLANVTLLIFNFHTFIENTNPPKHVYFSQRKFIEKVFSVRFLFDHVLKVFDFLATIYQHFLLQFFGRLLCSTFHIRQHIFFISDILREMFCLEFNLANNNLFVIRLLFHLKFIMKPHKNTCARNVSSVEGEKNDRRYAPTKGNQKWQ